MTDGLVRRTIEGWRIIARSAAGLLLACAAAAAAGVIVVVPMWYFAVHARGAYTVTTLVVIAALVIWGVVGGRLRMGGLRTFGARVLIIAATAAIGWLMAVLVAVGLTWVAVPLGLALVVLAGYRVSKHRMPSAR